MSTPWPAILGALLVLAGASTIAVVTSGVIARDRHNARTRLQVLAWARYEVLVDSPGLWTWNSGTAQVRALVQGTVRDCVVRDRGGQPWVGVATSGTEADRRPLS